MKTLLTLYLILRTLVTLAQNKEIDSLQQALTNFHAQKVELNKPIPDEGDTTEVYILNDLSRAYFLISDFEPAKKNAIDALAISQQLQFKKGIATSYHNIGNVFWSQSNYAEALKNHNAALSIRKEIVDKKGIAASYNNIGTVYNMLGNYPAALKNYFAALKIKEEIGDKKGFAGSYGNIGSIYFSQGYYPEALKYYLAALKLQEGIGDKYGIALTYGNIGNVYDMQRNYEEALKNHNAALKINIEIQNKQELSKDYYNIGLIYYKHGKYQEALTNYFASLKIQKDIGDKDGIVYSSTGIGRAKVRMQNAAEGTDWLNRALELSKETGNWEGVKNSYQSLAEADSALGNFRGAYENHKLFVLYRDSLNNEENTKKITQQQMQYEFDKKEAETKVLSDAELKKQKLVRNGFVGGFAVVLLFAGVFFRQRNKTKKEKKRSEDLLLNILPVDIAEEIKTTGTAKAKAFTMATVMFTDFKDFTTISEKISAELLVDEIHTCFSAFDHILQKHKIEKIKTIGDAYLCASGLPVSNYTHAVDMMNAAFEICNYMLQRKKEKEAKGEIPFELRIGIHTGPVVAGVVGVKKYAYDIWGDTVNIAARMEQNSEAGKINISGTTYELVKNKFNCTHRGKISAKNKGEIDMYFVEKVS